MGSKRGVGLGVGSGAGGRSVHPSTQTKRIASSDRLRTILRFCRTGEIDMWKLAPDFFGRFYRQLQFCPLYIFVDFVAMNGTGKTTLWAEADVV